MEKVMFSLLLLIGISCSAVSGYAHLNSQVLCSKLRPVKHLNLHELEGVWLTVEALLLRDGYPEPPAQAQRKTCVRSLISEASESGMSMMSEVHIGKSKRKTGRTKFIVEDRQQPGRWNMKSRRPSALVTEMIAIGARPDQFLVLAFCQPYNEDEEVSSRRPALWVKILARPNERGALVDQGDKLEISKRELHLLRERIAEMLGLKDLVTVHFDTSC